MKRLHTLLTALLLTPAAALHAADARRPAGKPNVVLILADDLGYGDVGSYGATRIRTPNIDRLAREGRRFTNAYAPGSVCSPSRYGLMAGRYAWREPRHPLTGVHSPAGPLLFDRDRLTLARLFQRSGYRTAAVGKWHLGFGEGDDPRKQYDWSQQEIEPGPLEVGFDSFYGMAGNAGNHPRIYIENHRFAGRKPGDVVRRVGRSKLEPWSPDAEFEQDRVAGDIARKGVEFIERSAGSGEPFFLYFASNIAHGSITPAAAFAGKSDCGPYCDFVQELDAHVGWLLDALSRAGIADDTLVLFTNDNGGVVAEGERPAAQWQAKQAGHAISGALRGGKRSIYEGGLRVPFIVRWPGHVPAGTTSDAMLCLTDVLATFAALLGDELPDGAGEDSFDALSAWKGEPGSRVRESVVLASAAGIFAIREGDWKLIERNESLPGSRGWRSKAEAENQDQLFHLLEDPGEKQNLWAQRPEIAKRLTGLLARARAADRTRPGTRGAASGPPGAAQ
jgi:arylsulfatase A-like enzyme